ncbi:MAG: sigma-70 family RNA polymerase sigma factor [Leptospira sp.]|nr:sigma-70 family RNA polymerase sigma factor [Leptospira sp.]
MKESLDKQSDFDHLFRNEARKMIAVLVKIYGFHRVDLVEDIVQDTFISALNSWKLNGLPEKPTAWLYSVAKNKIINQIKRENLYDKIIKENTNIFPLEYSIISKLEEGQKEIEDTQLKMFFCICHPDIHEDSQIALALKTLCAFSIDEISRSFLISKDTVNKRLYRAREKIRFSKMNLEFPEPNLLTERLDRVLKCIYLLFNEGYYSSSKETILRKDLCLEAMRLTILLTENQMTNLPNVNALLAIMCYHSSRFESRMSDTGEIFTLEEQDKSKWSTELIQKGHFYLSKSISSDTNGEYQIQAMIAYLHTIEDSPTKWSHLLSLYEKLFNISYSPIVAMNKAFVLSKVCGVNAGINELLTLNGLGENHLYHLLLSKLYQSVDVSKANFHLQTCLNFCPSQIERSIIKQKFGITEQ